MNAPTIPGQLNNIERTIIRQHLRSIGQAETIIEVGTWRGGGSTLSILNVLKNNQRGHLWGIEANPDIYEEMLANLQQVIPDGLQYFTPIFGFSQRILPALIAEKIQPKEIDLVFLDGGDNPKEQIIEFNLLAPHIRVGGILLSHDAKCRKGKWLVPYIKALDNWQCQLHEISKEGLFEARKIAATPSLKSLKKARWLLFKKRLQPIEVIAAIIPSRICGMLLNMLPSQLQRRLAGGCK